MINWRINGRKKGQIFYLADFKNYGNRNNLSDSEYTRFVIGNTLEKLKEEIIENTVPEQLKEDSGVVYKIECLDILKIFPQTEISIHP